MMKSASGVCTPPIGSRQGVKIIWARICITIQLRHSLSFCRPRELRHFAAKGATWQPVTPGAVFESTLLRDHF